MPVQIKPILNYDTGYLDKKIIITMADFAQMFELLRDRPILIFDFETSGLEWFKKSSACGIGLGSWLSNGVFAKYYVPYRHITGEQQLSFNVIRGYIDELLRNPNSLKIAHNLKFDEHIANRDGWEIAGPRYDTMIAARLYDENRSATLKGRAVDDLSRPEAVDFERNVKDEIYNLAKRNNLPVAEYRNTYGYSQVNIPLIGLYCCFDIEFTGLLYQMYEARGISTKYKRIWDNEMLLTGVLTKMEQHGIPIDTHYLETLRAALGGVRAGLEDCIQHKLGGYTINLGSDAELRELLITRLGITLSKLTKGKKLSVDKEVLKGFVSAHPVLQDIIEWKEADKLYSTYTQSILDRLDKDGIVHTDLQQVGTYTGRLSCRGPNLQNQASDSNDRAVKHSGKSLEDGGRDPWSIRRAFIVGREQYVRLFFDYSQIELRVLAFYSQDEVLINAYMNNEDIHTRTSLEVFGTKAKSKRRLSKAINFGIPFGITEHGYSAQTGVSLAEASEYLSKYFERYKGVAKFRKEFWDILRRNGGYFQNIFGRPRRIPEINSSNDYKRSKAERKAISTLIQGTAAELTKESLVRIDNYLAMSQLPAYSVLTIHDEIQIDCHVSVMAQVCRDVKKLMENFLEFNPIPIVVDIEYSTTNWADKVKAPL